MHIRNKLTFPIIGIEFGNIAMIFLLVTINEIFVRHSVEILGAAVAACWLLADAKSRCWRTAECKLIQYKVAFERDTSALDSLPPDWFEANQSESST